MNGELKKSVGITENGCYFSLISSIKDTAIRVNENIYDYKLKDLAGDLYAIMDGVDSLMKTVLDLDRNAVNSIFKAILKGMEKWDYLLVADVLMFELLPLVEAGIEINI